MNISRVSDGGIGAIKAGDLPARIKQCGGDGMTDAGAAAGNERVLHGEAATTRT